MTEERKLQCFEGKGIKGKGKSIRNKDFIRKCDEEQKRVTEEKMKQAIT